ncbi:hypothetical protein AB0D11_38520 [Streptomyces monashensis]|uniref:hypothetical protein n=1 Tax=Streptomyces monashensis TaxID=1678012 RepID=UPI0033CDFDAB
MGGAGWVLAAGFTIMAAMVVLVVHQALEGTAARDREQVLKALAVVFRALAELVRALWGRR